MDRGLCRYDEMAICIYFSPVCQQWTDIKVKLSEEQFAERVKGVKGELADKGKHLRAAFKGSEVR